MTAGLGANAQPVEGLAVGTALAVGLDLGLNLQLDTALGPESGLAEDGDGRAQPDLLLVAGALLQAQVGGALDLDPGEERTARNGVGLGAHNGVARAGRAVDL